MTVSQAATAARESCPALAALTGEQKNEALHFMAKELLGRKEQIFAANKEDISRATDLSAPALKRLKFDEPKLMAVVEGLAQLAALPNPVGRTQLATELSPGLRLYRVSCPIGVIGVIFESRPDALVQIASLCYKSGNAVLLKGGREAEATNAILFACLQRAARKAGAPEGWCHLLTTREEVAELLSQHEQVQLLIPRGSNEFVNYILEHTRIPVMGHADGVCHVFADETADIAASLPVIKDAKTQYAAVCNALETLLVHEKIAPVLLPLLPGTLPGVTLYGCEKTRAFLPIEPVENWHTEYLDYKLSVKIVSGVEEAIMHINRYGSGHTDAILTTSEANARLFLERVDSANVYWNCSTRFADGFRYGFGAEVGISTARLHARGPVGLEGLQIYKYKLLGSNQTVAEFAAKPFTHIPLSEDCPL